MTRKVQKHREPQQWYPFREVVDSTGLTELLVEIKGNYLGEADAYTRIRARVQELAPNEVRKDGPYKNSPIVVTARGAQLVRHMCQLAKTDEIQRLSILIYRHTRGL